MTIILEIKGVEYTNFTDASVTLALDTLANDFEFNAVLPAGETLPFKGGDACTVLVNNTRILTGSIENISGSYSAGDHTVSVSGRDRTGDLIDSSINAVSDLRAGITLKQIIEQIVSHIGSDLKVIADVNVDPFNTSEDIAAPQPGDNAFMFVEQYAQKRRVLLTSNADGDIVITSSNPAKKSGLLQNVVGADNNNIVSASWSYLTTGLYNTYIQKSQLDPVALSKSKSNSVEGVITQEGIAKDERVRKGRQSVLIATVSFSDEQLTLRAEWSKKIKRSRGVAYSCTVQGFTNSEGDLWRVNTLVTVVDEFANINRDLLINTVSFAFGSQGSVTVLGILEADAYELLATEPKPVGENQDSFIS